ncbi:MAG: 4-hydroxy-tetrahydrodipicolinate reductase [Alphaproteobacteria bacterium]|nr:4-hydroxy-tetrahydrodipicolinate reductase [Alphaproteobacteria bacterium]
MAGNVQIGILGCMGRMGQAITAEILKSDLADFVAGSEIASHPGVGKPIPGTDVMLADSAEHVFHEADVVIDFTSPGLTSAHAALAAETGTALVVGTTGMTKADDAALDRAAESVAVMQAGNYSLGVNLMMALVRDAAKRLGTDWDIEIVEMHHKHKVDAPSGTALMLGEAAAEGRGKPLDDLRTPAREGMTGERKEGTIGFAALRGGAVIGEHDVVFASESERLTISHRAENRGLFAAGAVKAALWVAAKGPGRYAMADVLDLA